jgi:hypothetical protein
VGRPGYCQWAKSKLVLENVRLIEAIFSPGSRNQTIVLSWQTLESSSELEELGLALRLINFAILPFRESAGITNTFFIESDGRLYGRSSMAVLHSAIGSLIGNDALPAKPNLLR